VTNNKLAEGAGGEPVLLKAKPVATALLERVAKQVATFTVVPKLVVIQVGEDPASSVYVGKKAKTAAKLGIASEVVQLPATCTQEALLQLLDSLNTEPSIHAVLVQLPLPGHINTALVQQAIAPHKDVDGFHPVNVGLLGSGQTPYAVPCTPLGVMHLLEAYNIAVAGKKAVVVGRSGIVGKPMAQLLLQADATVTICHSRTVNVATITQQADITIVAIGKPNWLTGAMVKQGAVVIDVGINRLENGALVGDVDFESVAPLCKAITPVPGGVGPMTIAQLMANTVALSVKALSNG
jgi:methylenetetrahydrofolate dehydrogenase (NADP+) / methenyltetrahydrofolate cyclohydrolase